MVAGDDPYMLLPEQDENILEECEYELVLVCCPIHNGVIYLASYVAIYLHPPPPTHLVLRKFGKEE
jgi:hypothetical protein